MTKGIHSMTHPVTARPNRPAYWTDARLTRAASALWGRVAALRAEIARELRKHDDERLGVIAANVADRAELSIADVIGDLHLTEIERDVSELRGVESALERINAGTYGICIDCSEAVDPMRLEFNPHAAKCLRCQENAEGSHRRTMRPAATLSRKPHGESHPSPKIERKRAQP